MLDERHNPYLLEINTLPGFTPKSLLPEAAAHGGVGFAELVDRLVRRAQRARARRPGGGFAAGHAGSFRRGSWSASV